MIGGAVRGDLSAGVLSPGVSVVEVGTLPDSSSSPSSTPNDNLPLVTVFRFFFFGSDFGVDPLCFDHQHDLHHNLVHSLTWLVPAFSQQLTRHSGFPASRHQGRILRS